jgi:hypothetical protein
MKKNLNSVKIEISGIVYNYPIDIPIPRIGETVCINEVSGIVKDIFHQIRSKEISKNIEKYIYVGVYIHTR